MNIDNIRTVLKDKRLSKGLSAEKLGKQVGVNKTTIYRYEKGEIDKMPLQVVNKLSEILEINPLFLSGLSEESRILKESNNIQTIYNQLKPTRQQKVYSFAEHQLEEQNSKIVNLDDYRTIELQSTVSAGTGVVDLEPNHNDTIEYRGKLPKHYDMAFKVDGNSMEPMFKDGDIIFVEQFEEAINGALMVVTVDDEAFVKKVYVENSHMKLVSLNPNYKDIIVNGENNIKVVGKVVF